MGVQIKLLLMLVRENFILEKELVSWPMFILKK